MFRLGHLIGRTIDVATGLACIAVVLMMAQITIEVVTRYLFGLAMPATIAMVSNYYMVFVAFLPLALAERREGHISVELVTSHLPDRIQHHLYGWIHLFSAIALGFLTYAGWIEATTKHAIGAFIIERNIRVPVWPSYYLFPFGCGLMAVTLLYQFVIYLFSSTKGLAEGASDR